MVLYRNPYDDEADGFQGGGGGASPPPGQPFNVPPADPSAPIPGLIPGIGGGNGGGGGGGGNARPMFNFLDAPEFVPPQFQRPSMEDAMREPGYQFRLQGGSDALERSAAARGALRTGGTLRDVLEYGQNFATQEYGNVFNRALQGFDRDYRGAYDRWGGNMAEWQFLSGAEQAAAMAQFARQGQGGGGGGGGQPPWMPPLPPEPEWGGGNVWKKTGNPPIF